MKSTCFLSSVSMLTVLLLSACQPVVNKASAPVAARQKSVAHYLCDRKGIYPDNAKFDGCIADAVAAQEEVRVAREAVEKAYKDMLKDNRLKREPGCDAKTSDPLSEGWDFYDSCVSKQMHAAKPDLAKRYDKVVKSYADEYLKDIQ